MDMYNSTFYLPTFYTKFKFYGFLAFLLKLGLFHTTIIDSNHANFTRPTLASDVSSWTKLCYKIIVVLSKDN